MKDYIKTSVIVATINRKATMRRLLECIAAQTIPVGQLIMIEGGQTVWTAEDLPAALRTVSQIVYSPAISLAGARALGQRHATGDVLVFFDDDILIESNYIEHVLCHLRRDSKVMAVGGPYRDRCLDQRRGSTLLVGRLLGIYADGRRNRLLRSGWADYARGPGLADPTSAEWLFGCNFAIRATAFPALPFEEKMAAWSFLEDVFLGQHLQKLFGDCIRLIPTLEVLHDPPGSSGAISPATLRMRILYRYMLWRDHVRPRYPLSHLSFMLGMFANLLLMLKQEKRTWVIPECGRSLLYILKNIDMNWDQANAHVFAKN
jgi:GT2 family glycosyltransferase